MEDATVESALDRAEEQIADGRGLSGTGFWGAVSRVKSDPALVDRYAARIATIDDAAFRSWALLVVPQGLGTLLALIATAAGLFMVGLAYGLEGWTAVIVFFAGFGVVWVTTHGLGHLAVGRLVGIRFTGWFVGTITRPQPGVKIDYDSYLRTPAVRRAWMHAAGAIVTKIVPFAMIGAAIAAGLPAWAPWLLAGLGTITIITDITLSTRNGDWSKFRRESRYAQRG